MWVERGALGVLPGDAEWTEKEREVRELWRVRLRHEEGGGMHEA